MGAKLTEDFLLLFCEKNSDGTMHLRLKGNELIQRIRTRLGPEDMFAVSKFLKDHKNIVSLDVCYNNIGDGGMTILSENYFDEDNNLESINLIQCDITAEGLKALSSSKFLKLKNCRINGNKLGTTGSRYIGRLIETCKTLQWFDISETDQTQESIFTVLIMIEKCNLTALNISRIIPSSYYSSYNAFALADDLGILLSLNSKLTELHIQKCEFDGHDVELILNGLKQNTSLLMLDLGCNNIGDHGIELIAEWLKSKPRLRGLNVSHNNIRNIGARSLSYGLPSSHIRLLDITHNQIKNTGLEFILYTLKKYTMMRMLFIWGNKFGPRVNTIINRLILAGILVQDYIDVKVYFVDGVPFSAYYPCNHYKHKYYCVMDCGSAVELKIKHNKIATPQSKPKALIELEHYPRFPPVEIL